MEEYSDDFSVVENLIDKRFPFTILYREVNYENGINTYKTQEIEVNSEVWNQIFGFMMKNRGGWELSSVSYIGDVYVIQSKFRIIYTRKNDRIVIAYVDNLGNTKYLIKSINKGEFDFL